MLGLSSFSGLSSIPDALAIMRNTETLSCSSIETLPSFVTVSFFIVLKACSGISSIGFIVPSKFIISVILEVPIVISSFATSSLCRTKVSDLDILLWIFLTPPNLAIGGLLLLILATVTHPYITFSTFINVFF